MSYSCCILKCVCGGVVRHYATGHDAIGGIFDAVTRNGTDTPGPGDFHPDEDDEEYLTAKNRRLPPKGPHFGKPPPRMPPGGPGVDLHTPSPGDYEPDAAPPRPRSRSQLPGPTISRGSKGPGAYGVADDVPGPGAFEIMYHPKTIVGAAREAAKQPGAMKPPRPPREGAVYRPPPGPGPGQYEPAEDPNVAPHRVGRGRHRTC